jgi:hypothetical protein
MAQDSGERILKVREGTNLLRPDFAAGVPDCETWGKQSKGNKAELTTQHHNE